MKPAAPVMSATRARRGVPSIKTPLDLIPDPGVNVTHNAANYVRNFTISGQYFP
jgi:hypothetical protein